MAIEDGKDCRNWLKNKDDHMAIKEKRRMLKFKLHVFSSALYEEKRNYKKLMTNTERRKQTYKPQYQTREELDQAYVLGAINDKEYMKNRSAIWLVYSDRGHIKNIEWLESEVAKYEGALAELEEWMNEKHEESVRRKRKKQQRKLHHRRYNKHRLRKIRAAEKKERLERERAERREKERIEMEEIEKIKQKEREEMERESLEYFGYDDE